MSRFSQAHMIDVKLDEWHFDFGLCGADQRLVSTSDCNELLDVIIDWAEEHGYYIGGGFGPFSESHE